MCRKYVGEKPKDVVECVGDCTGTGWIHGSWGEVSSNRFLFDILLYIVAFVSVIMRVAVVFENVSPNVETHQV